MISFLKLIKAWSPNPEQAGPDNPDGGLISEPTNAHDGISNSPVLYLATSEVQNDTLEELFFDNLDETRGDRVFSNDTGNLKSANLNPSEGAILGPGIMLKVMAGDQIQLGMEALYFNNTQPGAPVPLANIVSGLLGVLRGQGGLIDGIGAGSLAGNLNADGLTMVVSQMQNQTQDSTKPKAFLNYLMFDESMQIVLEQSGALQVEQANAWSNLTQPIFQINQNGYIYVYSCNTSEMTVRTDNLFIAHYQGSLLEEFHYYPFGMCFDVSKSPTLGKSAAIKYNSQLHEHDEFEDANGNVYGLEDYNFAFRNYDAQIGRWLQPD
ncbi:MAG: hypothetical protein Q8R57_02845, partial [Bacteroidota bacterium]|nr:hypothetical protein [Bacteroidota bacterium]